MSLINLFLLDLESLRMKLTPPEMTEDMDARLREGIVLTTHAERRNHWERAFHFAVAGQADCWALLFKALALITAERYSHVLDLLKRAQFLGDCQYPRGHTFPLGVLLARAYLWRRVSGGLYKELQRHRHRFIDDTFCMETSQTSLDELAANAEKIYLELTSHSKNGVPIEFRAAAFHSMGVMEPYKIQWDQLRRQEAGPDWSAIYSRQQAFFKQAAGMAETENISYAPPYARIGGIYTARWESLRQEDKWGPPGRDLISEAMRFSQLAVEVAQRRNPLQAYSPALLNLAFCKYVIASIDGDAAALSNAKNDLRAAVEAAPFDADVWIQYASYLNARESQVADDGTGGLDLSKEALLIPSRAIQLQLGSWVKGTSDSTLTTANTDKLLILRRWSSYSPIVLRGRGGTTCGGGYLLNWKGKWIALDPGLGFVKAIYEHGVSPGDIDAIAITHDDTDHQQEMQALLALIKEHDNRFTGSTAGLPRRPLHLLLSTSSYERWSNRLPKLKNRRRCLHHLCTGPGRPRGGLSQAVTGVRLFGGTVSITATPTYGHFDIGDIERGRNRGSTSGTGIGYIFELRDSGRGSVVAKVGITGDTAYCDAKENRISPSYCGCDVLVVHVSTVEDLDPSRQEIDKSPRFQRLTGPNSGYYRKHLGLWGTAALLTDLALEKSLPSLVLLNEFGEELLPLRRWLTREIRGWVSRIAGSSVSRDSLDACLPTDVGTRVDLRRRVILCQFGKVCPSPAGGVEDSAPVSPFEITLGETDATTSHQAWRDRRLVYLCREHDDVADWEDVDEFC